MFRRHGNNGSRALVPFRQIHLQQGNHRRRPGYTPGECIRGPQGPWPRNNKWHLGRSNGCPRTCNRGNPLEDHVNGVCYELQTTTVLRRPRQRRHHDRGYRQGSHHPVVPIYDEMNFTDDEDDDSDSDISIGTEIYGGPSTISFPFGGSGMPRRGHGHGDRRGIDYLYPRGPRHAPLGYSEGRVPGMHPADLYRTYGYDDTSTVESF